MWTKDCSNCCRRRSEDSQWCHQHQLGKVLDRLYPSFGPCYNDDNDDDDDDGGCYIWNNDNRDNRNNKLSGLS
jgi:hypothetical protein